MYFLHLQLVGQLLRPTATAAPRRPDVPMQRPARHQGVAPMEQRGPYRRER